MYVHRNLYKYNMYSLTNTSTGGAACDVACGTLCLSGPQDSVCGTVPATTHTIDTFTNGFILNNAELVNAMMLRQGKGWVGCAHD